MRDFQDTFETCKLSFIIALSICMTVPLKSPANYTKLHFSVRAFVVFSSEINRLSMARLEIVHL